MVPPFTVHEYEVAPEALAVQSSGMSRQTTGEAWRVGADGNAHPGALSATAFSSVDDLIFVALLKLAESLLQPVNVIVTVQNSKHANMIV
ncbi:MAG TPA: hypothetical protein PLP23_10250 [Panacibacter sp.]|nr:hypothetical protein [Panacibacter sp.]